ncbi:hypothetical protein NQ315_006106 [Exocentrus adspersus]|uniref:Uncharacterized protein n=1 Tax=Exocentrus adspersus TaxID=1586481 RepID=A0AAV8VE95_9CUCU|nr:hypothetical protein NQ315_006106 [Exocentrus adspersus]
MKNKLTVNKSKKGVISNRWNMRVDDRILIGNNHVECKSCIKFLRLHLTWNHIDALRYRTNTMSRKGYEDGSCSITNYSKNGNMIW